jgi:hypothetical protein
MDIAQYVQFFYQGLYIRDDAMENNIQIRQQCLKSVPTV